MLGYQIVFDPKLFYQAIKVVFFTNIYNVISSFITWNNNKFLWMADKSLVTAGWLKTGGALAFIDQRNLLLKLSKTGIQ